MGVVLETDKVNFSPAPGQVFPMYFLDKIRPLWPLAPGSHLEGTRGGAGEALASPPVRTMRDSDEA